ncbi:MAG: VWA domain-containing protein, partial [Pseudomonadota bacterium]
MIDQLANLHFLRPTWLAALLAAPLIGWMLWRRQLARSRWAELCDEDLLSYLGFDPGKRQRHGWIVAVVVGWMVATIALAGPAFRMQPQALFKSVDARVVLIDLSRSMLAGDLKPNRLDQARFKLMDLLDRVQEGQTALVAYAGEPFIVSPLTDDANTVRNMVGALDPSIMPAPGSEADEALTLAAELLARVGDGRGDILLLSDDVNAAAIEMAADLSARGIRVSVLGVGTPEGAPIGLPNGGVLKTDAGRIVIPQLNEDRLVALARAGGGRYARISSGPADLDLLLPADGSLPGNDDVEAADRESARWQDDGPWLVLLLLPLGALAFRRGVLLAGPLAVGLTLPTGAEAAVWDDWFRTPEQRAARAMDAEDFETAANLAEDPLRRGNAHYRSGDFEAAAQAFERAPGPDGAYNLGNALAQQQRYEEALAAYDRALAESPDMEDAVFNRELVEKLLEEQQQQEQ